MTAKALSPQIPFRYRSVDGPTGVTRKTAKRLRAQPMGQPLSVARRFSRRKNRIASPFRVA